MTNLDDFHISRKNVDFRSFVLTLALAVRFLCRRFLGEYDPTLEDTYSKTMLLNGKLINMSIVDTAGEVRVPGTFQRVLPFLAFCQFNFENGCSTDSALNFATYGYPTWLRIAVCENHGKGSAAVLFADNIVSSSSGSGTQRTEKHVLSVVSNAHVYAFSVASSSACNIAD